MTITVLNLISAFLAIAATYVGVTEQDTWSKGKKRPTKIGAIVILLACSTAVIQIAAQVIDLQDIKKRKTVYENAYNGWVSVGVYDIKSNKWEKFLLQGLDAPYTISEQDLYIVTTDLYGHAEPPPFYCPDKNNGWFESETNTIFFDRQLIEIREVRSFRDCPASGKVRVIAKIVDASL